MYDLQESALPRDTGLGPFVSRTKLPAFKRYTALFTLYIECLSVQS